MQSGASAAAAGARGSVRAGRETAPRAHSGRGQSLGAASTRGHAGPHRCPRSPAALQFAKLPPALGRSRNAKGAGESGSPLRFMGRTRTATFTFVSDMLAARCSARRGPFKRRAAAAAAAAAARPPSAAAAAPPRAPRRSAEARGPSRGSATRGTAGPGEGRARGGARQREEAAGPSAALAARAGPSAQHRGPSRPPGAGQRRHLPLRGPRPGCKAAADREGALYKGERLRPQGSRDTGRDALQRRSGSGLLGLEKEPLASPVPEPAGDVTDTSWSSSHLQGPLSPSQPGPWGGLGGIGEGAGCAGLIHAILPPPLTSTAHRPSAPHTELCRGVGSSLWGAKARHEFAMDHQNRVFVNTALIFFPLRPCNGRDLDGREGSLTLT